MAITLSLSPVNLDGSASNLMYAVVGATFSGSYSTGGDTVDFTQIADKLESTQIINAIAESNSATNTAFGQTGGYFIMQGNPTTTPGQSSPVATALNAWKMKLFNGGGTELAAGAYPASVTSDNVQILLTLRKLN